MGANATMHFARLADGPLRAERTLRVSVAELYRGEKKVVYDAGDAGTGVADADDCTDADAIVIDLGALPVEDFTPSGEEGVVVVVYGRGHELRVDGGVVIVGNLHVRVKVVVQEDALYRMDSIGFPHDLHATLHVGIADYFFGRSFALPHPSGLRDAPPVFVEYDGGQTVRVFPGGGMRGRGTLYVHFDLAMPPRSRGERDALLDSLIARKREADANAFKR
jgi:DnaJ-class molecular chaperone